MTFAFRIHVGLAVGLVAVSPTHAVNPGQYIPYTNSGHFEYRPRVCDRFLRDHSKIEIITPTSSKPSMSDIARKCPSVRIDHKYGAYSIPLEGVGYNDRSLYRVDLDNDGEEDTIVFSIVEKSRFTSNTLWKIDVEKCTGQLAFGAGGTTKIIRLGRKTFIETTDRFCRGPYDGKYISCKGLYFLKKSKLAPAYGDRECLYIDRSWLSLRASERSKGK